jgi:ABC-2 type transport system permease protein
MMLRGLWRLTWLEIRIFLREPLGVFGTVVAPVLLFLALGRLLGRRVRATDLAAPESPATCRWWCVLSPSTLSLVAIMAIYREAAS